MRSQSVARSAPRMQRHVAQARLDHAVPVLGALGREQGGQRLGHEPLELHRRVERLACALERERIAEDLREDAEPGNELARPMTLAPERGKGDRPFDPPADGHGHGEVGLHADASPARLVGRGLGGQLVEPREQDRMAGLEALHRPGEIPGHRPQHRRSEGVYGPRVGEVRLARPRCKADQVRAVHVEQPDDPPERIGDRVIDAGRGQVDEAGGQLRQQPLEREQLAEGRGIRRGHRTGRIDHLGREARSHLLRLRRCVCLQSSEIDWLVQIGRPASCSGQSSPLRFRGTGIEIDRPTVSGNPSGSRSSWRTSEDGPERGNEVVPQPA